MKKLFLLFLIISFFLVVFTGCKDFINSENLGEGEVESEVSGDEPGPAPNSGDGIPDGPGWEKINLSDNFI